MTFFKENVINIALPLSVVMQMSFETKGKEKEMALGSDYGKHVTVCMKLYKSEIRV